MTNIIIIFLFVIILYIIFYPPNEDIKEGFFRYSYKNDKGLDLTCLTDKSSMHKIIPAGIKEETDPLLEFPDGLTMKNIKCIGDLKPATQCYVFSNKKNSMGCKEQVGGDCYKMADGTVTCSDTPTRTNMFYCNGTRWDYNTGLPTDVNGECKRLYDAYGISPSLAQQGYTCNYGNGLVPVKKNGNIFSAQMSFDKVLRTDNNGKCRAMLNNSVGNTAEVTCTDGKTNQYCNALYDALGVKTFKELGFDCIPIAGKSYVAKIEGTGIKFASYDGVNPIEGCDGVINFSPSGDVTTIVCNTYQDANAICPVAFADLNLYPTANPLTIRGNNIHQAQPLLVTDTATLNKLSLNNINALSSINGYNPNTTNGIKNGLQEVLTNYPVNVACCNRRQGETTGLNAPVHVPLSPSNYDPTQNKWKYELDNLSVPATNCSDEFYAGSSKCNAFYDVNCANQLANFKTLGLPETEFPDYSPECACYAPKLPAEQQYSNNIPPKCYKANCGMGTSYLDPISRDGQCNLTICSSIINATDISAGGTATLSNQVKNECGNFLPPEPTGNGNTSVTIPTVPNPSASRSGSIINPLNPQSPNTQPSSNPTTPSSNGSAGTGAIVPPTDENTTNINNNVSAESSGDSSVIIQWIIIVLVVLLCGGACWWKFMR